MATTIQLEDNTAMALRKIRDDHHLNSLNETVQHLIRAEKSKKSFWGAGNRKMPMVKILEGLRDERD